MCVFCASVSSVCVQIEAPDTTDPRAPTANTALLAVVAGCSCSVNAAAMAGHPNGKLKARFLVEI